MCGMQATRGCCVVVRVQIKCQTVEVRVTFSLRHAHRAQLAALFSESVVSYAATPIESTAIQETTKESQDPPTHPT